MKYFYAFLGFFLFSVQVQALELVDIPESPIPPKCDGGNCEPLEANPCVNRKEGEVYTIPKGPKAGTYVCRKGNNVPVSDKPPKGTSSNSGTNSSVTGNQNNTSGNNSGNQSSNGSSGGAGGGSGSGTGSSTGNGSGNTNHPSGNNSGNSGSGSGSSAGNGSGNTNQPIPPSDQLPPIPNIPNVPTTGNPELDKAINNLRQAYMDLFESLKAREIFLRARLMNELANCVKFRYTPESRRACAEDAYHSFNYNLKELKEAFEKAKQQMARDFAEIAKKAGVHTPPIPYPDTGNTNTDGSQGNSSNGGNTTVNVDNSTTNIDNSDNSSGDTTNNSSVTVNNGGSGNGNNHGITDGKDYSGILGDIKGTLDGISAKIGSLVGIGNGGTGNDIGEGFCKEGDDSLACVKVGDEQQIKAAISKRTAEIKAEIGQGEAARDKLGINTHRIDLAKVKRSSDFTETGNCPSPKRITLMGSTQEVSYQPFCDAAMKLRPIVILSAILMAFFIVSAAVSRS